MADTALRMGSRVEMFGFTGEIIAFVDYHCTLATVRWDGGSIEYVATSRLRPETMSVFPCPEDSCDYVATGSRANIDVVNHVSAVHLQDKDDSGD